jgi:dUTP pyrophosphatase
MNNTYKYATLKIYTDNAELKEIYVKKAQEHNYKMSFDFYDSGFDLYCPNEVCFNEEFETVFINMGIKTEMTSDEGYVGFNVYPRSSIAKTPLLIANSVGIIDSGYRGEIIGAFRSFKKDYIVEKHTRLLQIVHPAGLRIHVHVVDNFNELTTTERNDKGYGSSGK